MLNYEHLQVEIDELVSAGVVKMSTATFDAIKAKLAENDGHHEGTVGFVHRTRHELEEKLLAEQQERELALQQQTPEFAVGSGWQRCATVA